MEKNIDEITFKKRVAKVAISCAKIYKEGFVDFEYLVCSEAFGDNTYYEIKAEANNYLHLLGINTNLSPNKFYQKCIDDTLSEDDFNFDKKGQSSKSVKGSVRQKIKALPEMLMMFEHELFAEKNFKKNKIYCAFATANSHFTIGFVESGRPKSLMRKNQLDVLRYKPVELVLRKKRGMTLYSEIVIGTKNELEKYKDYIYKFIDKDIINEEIK